jgi:hypothetical protein
LDYPSKAQEAVRAGDYYDIKQLDSNGKVEKDPVTNEDIVVKRITKKTYEYE